MDLTSLIPYAIPTAIITCAIVARVGSDLKTQATARNATKVAQIEGTVSRLAAGIASDLLDAEKSGAATNVVAAIKGAAVAQAADYMSTQLPDTLKAVGATKDGLIGMLSGEASKQKLAAMAPALLSAASAALLSSLPPNPAPADSAAEAASADTAGPAAAAGAAPAV